MLELRKISKIYETTGFKQQALEDVSINFRECEFASILGPSGSGKTTLLNIIGGLDHYTSGDLVINEISTKKFKDSDWDSYRNHRIGFVFQSYNLISHQTILSNVCLALTLSGISKKESLERAKKALKDVGLEKHMNKKPTELSGGQMQRVAIARALVNNPDILLADEPTGALDSETSIQIMKLLKKIAKNKLVIMVTHNPELAKEYSTRIITLKDGKITSDTDPYDGKINTKENQETKSKKQKKTKMSFKTALGLSFNNLLTKKGRTVLVSLAGSIGIIGIALIMSVSTGFQNYVDSIQEDTLTSYPLTIMQESSDVTSMLLSMTSGNGENDESGEVVEKQYISSMLSSISTNDLKSFKNYLEKNYNKVDSDISNVQYNYSIDPYIYTIDATNKLSRLNPNTLFSSMMGSSSSIMSSYSSMTSIFNQMVDDTKDILDDYDVLVGKWPENYDEVIIVLSEPNSISDLLVYSLGLRDTDELTSMVTKIMSGESVDIDNEPLKFTYEELLNVDLRLILSADTYKYNSKYDVYEDMSEDSEYMNNLYNNATKLKIVGIVSPKQGVTSMALSPGISYTSDLIDYIINSSKEKEIVKKQLSNLEVDVFSGNRFDSKTNDYGFAFSDLVSIDTEKLQSAFNINIDTNTLQKQTENYMEEISNSITTDTEPALNTFKENLTILSNNVFLNINEEFLITDIDTITNTYLESYEVGNILSEMEANYVIPKDTLKQVYSGLLKGLLNAYANGYNTYMESFDSEYVSSDDTPILINNELKETILSSYLESVYINTTCNQMANVMTEALMKKTVLTKVGELTSNLTNSFASSFNIDESKIAEAFSLNFTEDELTRVVSAMMNKTESTAKSNLISLGYQDKDEPTYISFYFNSFDGKEHFLEFIDSYNKKVDEDKKINYTDTTGILMSSVKTIVNAVSYVLIAFVSISLVVSSIMIGVITYISVYERTKEIGILRAIGASKHNISSIFNAETFIIGLLSGIFGIGISYLLIPIINGILHHYTGNIPLNAMLEIKNGLLLILLSIILTLIGGLIPASSASKKDPVIALRTE